VDENVIQVFLEMKSVNIFTCFGKDYIFLMK